jgi:nitrogen fixation NifU-like protein
MSDLRELYQEIILDHNKKPRNYGKMECPSKQANGFNPLCGDRVCIYLKMSDGTVEDVAFEGKGCAICIASASMMPQTMKGRHREDARKIFTQFHDLVTGKGCPGGVAAELGKLAAFAGVSEFPARVKCATLAWHTFNAAIDGKDSTISTE